MFPSDLQPEYYFSLNFKTYSRPNPFTGQINLSDPAVFLGGWGGSMGIGAAPAVNPSGINGICLPIPANIINSQSLKWEQTSSMLGAATTQAWDDLTGGKDPNIIRDLAAFGIGSAGILGAALSSIGGAVANPGAAAAGAGAMQAVPALAASVLQKSGLALNPVLTQMFSNPEFKQHEFTWKFAPESQGESQTLKDIIDTIEYNALPGTAVGGLFFTYPSIALLEIHTGATQPYKFQPCVVRDIAVNFAGAGVPSWFAGTSAPTVVEMKVTFLEIILNTRENAGFRSGETPINWTAGQISNGPSISNKTISSFFGS